ncbi:hypothetical protein QR680_010584 [Steinernema hermaphroditum]|uniref:Uncharacterized protein n=1 Tax=Steinernema hermaphroditum TaxID=289476 RepID=A0AA39MBH1_9BILA|nr:hypothetical protein QR680_010584 [Steinernema hermaphroditum]
MSLLKRVTAFVKAAKKTSRKVKNQFSWNNADEATIAAFAMTVMPNVHVKKKLSSFGKAARRASNKFRRNLQGGSSKAPEPPKAEIVEKKVSNEAAAAYPVALFQ